MIEDMTAAELREIGAELLIPGGDLHRRDQLAKRCRDTAALLDAVNERARIVCTMRHRPRPARCGILGCPFEPSAPDPAMTRAVAVLRICTAMAHLHNQPAGHFRPMAADLVHALEALQLLAVAPEPQAPPFRPETDIEYRARLCGADSLSNHQKQQVQRASGIDLTRWGAAMALPRMMVPT